MPLDTDSKEGEKRPAQKRSSLAQKPRPPTTSTSTSATTTTSQSTANQTNARRQEHHPYQRASQPTHAPSNATSETTLARTSASSTHVPPLFPPVTGVLPSSTFSFHSPHDRHTGPSRAPASSNLRERQHQAHRHHPYARPPPPSSRSMGNAAKVAEHYNRHQQQSHEERKQSMIFRLRSFNNWVKSVLIAQAVKQRRTRRVLDMGCGKGGDLLKWAKARIDYLVGVDIASVSIEQARGRWSDIRHNRFQANFYALDCYEHPLNQVIPSGEKFDIVTQQFCLHYAFETEHKARQMIKNVADYLDTGGRWIGTLPDAYWITKKLQSIDGLKFGNRVYYIEFDQKDTFPTYGHRYIFHLEDAIESCPEYLVHFPTLVELAKEHGMQLVQRTPFHQYYERSLNDPEARQLLTRMKVIGDRGEGLSREEWEVAGAYLVFEFVRT